MSDQMVEKSLTKHKDLQVWKTAMDLVAEVYSVTSWFPKEELYGLTSQVRRAAISIPSNIAEGAARHSRKEFVQFPHVASGSVAELETHLLLAARLGFGSMDNVLIRTEEVRKLLLGLLRALKKKPITHHASRTTS
jgi:four helix bundle protein